MPADRFRVVRLEELEPSPARPEWIPVRRPLGVASFGVNAWSGHAGTELVPDHDETATGHEELYVVTEGHARFTLDGDVVEAPAGTVVHVPDPATTRGAVAGAG